MGSIYRRAGREARTLQRKLGRICAGLVVVEVALVAVAVVVGHDTWLVAAWVTGGITLVAAFTWGVLWLIHNG